MRMHVDETRAIIELTGEDRRHFLQGIITQDIEQLKPERGIFAALLSPQGKVLHDFFLIEQGDTILLDTHASGKADLLKRLTMYKLRAKVNLRDASAAWQVAYRTSAEHSAIGHVTRKKHLVLLTDPRAAELGERLYIEAGQVTPKGTATLDEYHDHRIRLGIPDTRDLQDDVALDAGYDLLNAVSFTKGCYVGQEVTARMHYKNIARRGFYVVEAEGPISAEGKEIIAGGIKLGTVRGMQGPLGLALLKFEETENALASGTFPAVENQVLRLRSPSWLQPKLAQFRAARENQ
jgi:folate-binding protein YgfZ